ncbi:hypothetical protein MNBD_GAMMA03-1647 [hydrothermal vent metagenome]|uniref:Uncharacterized protein n=1 Tax=hydrothermal vent metagenome TaxID=652676 RepID=A0A3B0VT08_9ZZZZ
MMKQWTVFFAWGIFFILPTAIFANVESEWEELFVPSSVQDSEEKKRANTLKVTEQHIDDQVLYIDQEILILKAELAQQYGHTNELRNYLNQLDEMTVLPVFQNRFEHLKHFLMAPKMNPSPLKPIHQVPVLNTNTYLTVNHIQPLDFLSEGGGKNSVIAILLPLTEAYEQVGNQLLESLTNALETIGFKGTLVVLDTVLHDSSFEIWQLLQHYEPNFIFGPLRKSVATQWQALNTGVPTLYFNEMPFLYGTERALSPSRSKGIEILLRFMEERDEQNILVLTDNHPVSQQLESDFYASWLAINSQGKYLHQTIDKTVGEAVEFASNIKRSKDRYLWLQKVVQHSLVFQPRAREDIDLVISFLSERNAMQVSPILDFYRLNSISRIWFPIQTPKVSFLKKNLSSWNHSYVVFPPYLSQNVQPRAAESLVSEKIGLFYALGQVAVEIVTNSTVSDGLELFLETEFGLIRSNSSGQFYLWPMIYWVDQHNNFEKVSLSL